MNCYVCACRNLVLVIRSLAPTVTVHVSEILGEYDAPNPAIIEQTAAHIIVRRCHLFELGARHSDLLIRPGPASDLSIQCSAGATQRLAGYSYSSTGDLAVLSCWRQRNIAVACDGAISHDQAVGVRSGCGGDISTRRHNILSVVAVASPAVLQSQDKCRRVRKTLLTAEKSLNSVQTASFFDTTDTATRPG